MLAIVQNSIDEMDFELDYIGINLSTTAKIYLNTIAFLHCFENRIKRDQEKLNNETMMNEVKKKEFYKNFEKEMLNK